MEIFNINLETEYCWVISSLFGADQKYDEWFFYLLYNNQELLFHHMLWFNKIWEMVRKKLAAMWYNMLTLMKCDKSGQNVAIMPKTWWPLVDFRVVLNHYYSPIKMICYQSLPERKLSKDSFLVYLHVKVSKC